ncbi:MAG: transposase, partial [Gammaproteobacteria bacterium]
LNINNRIDHSFGFENHFIRGKAKMQARVRLALAVMMAMALGHVNAGRIEQMRSLVRPIPATG